MYLAQNTNRCSQMERNNSKPPPLVLFGASFGCLGLLIGNMVGLSADSLARIVIPAILAFTGGSLLVILNKLSINQIRMAAVAIVMLSLSCLLGVYLGILQSEYRIFSPQYADHISNSGSPIQRKYLRDNEISRILSIDTQYNNQQIDAKVAYDQLFEVVQNGL